MTNHNHWHIRNMRLQHQILWPWIPLTFRKLRHLTLIASQNTSFSFRTKMQRTYCLARSFLTQASRFADFLGPILHKYDIITATAAESGHHKWRLLKMEAWFQLFTVIMRSVKQMLWSVPQSDFPFTSSPRLLHPHTVAAVYGLRNVRMRQI